MNKTEKAYKEILKVLKKHESEIIFDIDALETKAKHHLYGVELVEKYGFELGHKKINNLGWQKLKENIVLGFWDGKNREISWPDDGRQPSGENLLCISFPTGAYFFGDDYPTEFFQEFFTELKTYKPSYTDTANKSLYFSLDNASKIYNAYDSIVDKYYKKNKIDSKRRNIAKLKAELAKLEPQP